MTTNDTAQAAAQAAPSNVVWALYYAQQGWEVFPLHSVTRTAPEAFERAKAAGTVEAFRSAALAAGCSCGKPNCKSPGKHPRTRNGVKDATRDEATIRAYWQQWPEANVGLRPPLGVVVLDFDWKDPTARERQAELLARGLPATATAASGYGEHWFFTYPPETKLPSKLGPGVDILHNGHRYAVAAPALHWSGNVYQWKTAPALPTGGTLAAAPAWLLAELTRKPVAVRPPPRGGASLGRADRVRRAAHKQRVPTRHRSDRMGKAPRADTPPGHCRWRAGLN